MHTPQTWKLTLAYDGTDYSGWQVQPGRATVQSELASAIARVTGEAVMPQGSGRTDAGVHALAQVASFQLTAPIPAENFKSALNKTLPTAVRILSAETASPDFHARHCAVRKTYEYRIFTGELCPPFLARYVATVKWPLDLSKMQQAAQHILGEHDFTSFAASDPDLAQRESRETSAPPSMVRTIFASDWGPAKTQVPRLRSPAANSARNDTVEPSDTLIYRVTGTGFLHHMVRNLVGTFLDVGRGHIAPDAIPQILRARDRSAAGPTASASGLFLRSVEYP